MRETVLSAEKIDVLSELRTATGQMHKALEETRLSKSMLHPEVTRADYQKYLAAMKEVIAYTEEIVFPKLSPVIDDLESRYKLSSIEKDLHFLGNSLPQYQPGNSFKADISNERSIYFSLGFMYVVEGSTLGGIYILKQLSKSLAITDHAGGSFFFGYGKETSKRWNDFLVVMKSNINNKEDAGQLIEGALYAFSCIHQFFESFE